MLGPLELGLTMKEWPHAKSSTGNWCLFLLVRPNPSTLHTQPQRVLLSTAHEQETDTDKRAQGFLRCAVPRGTRATALHSRPHFSPRAATRSREATCGANGPSGPMATERAHVPVGDERRQVAVTRLRKLAVGYVRMASPLSGHSYVLHGAVRRRQRARIKKCRDTPLGTQTFAAV